MIRRVSGIAEPGILEFACGVALLQRAVGIEEGGPSACIDCLGPAKPGQCDGAALRLLPLIRQRGSSWGGRDAVANGLCSLGDIGAATVDSGG